MSSSPRLTLGGIIRHQRELHELSIRRFAEMVGISNPYLSQIERGLRDPSEKVVDAIARNLDLSVDALYEQAGLDVMSDADEQAVRDAVRADRRLTARQRQALLEVYDAFLRANGEHPRRGRAASASALDVDDAH